MLWAPLFREPCFAERLTQRGCQRRRAIDTVKLSAVTEFRLQFHDACGDAPGFVEPIQPDKRRRQKHMRNTVARIELNGLVGGIDRFLEIAEVKMSERERMKG
jgi:hypothetical protein